jgi:NhaP-type Na+/H+ or K+/H+ antiporter
MELAIGLLIGASLGCSFGYVSGAIMRTAKQANFRSAQQECERDPVLPSAA